MDFSSIPTPFWTSEVSLRNLSEQDVSLQLKEFNAVVQSKGKRNITSEELRSCVDFILRILMKEFRECPHFTLKCIEKILEDFRVEDILQEEETRLVSRSITKDVRQCVHRCLDNYEYFKLKTEKYHESYGNLSGFFYSKAVVYHNLYQRFSEILEIRELNTAAKVNNFFEPFNKRYFQDLQLTSNDGDFEVQHFTNPETPDPEHSLDFNLEVQVNSFEDLMIEMGKFTGVQFQKRRLVKEFSPQEVENFVGTFAWYFNHELFKNIDVSTEDKKVVREINFLYQCFAEVSLREILGTDIDTVEEYLAHIAASCEEILEKSPHESFLHMFKKISNHCSWLYVMICQSQAESKYEILDEGHTKSFQTESYAKEVYPQENLPDDVKNYLQQTFEEKENIQDVIKVFNQDECPFCFGEISTSGSKELAVLPCCHVSCLGCAYQWFYPEQQELNNSCPICRSVTKFFIRESHFSEAKRDWDS